MRGVTPLGLMIAVVIPIIVAIGLNGALTGKIPSTDEYCRSGYVFDRHSGRQIIGENGGGIRCDKQQIKSL